MTEVIKKCVKVCYKEIKNLKEYKEKVDLAFEALFKEVLKMDFKYPQNSFFDKLTSKDI